MSQVEDNYELLAALAGQAARGIGRSFPQVEVEDLVQEAWGWCAKHPGTLRKYLADEQREKMIVGAMRNVCKDYARKQRAAQNGGDISDDAWYQHEELKALLPAMFDREAWLNPPKPEAKVKGGDPSEGNNWVTKLSDVQRGFDSLPPAQQEVLSLRFERGLGMVELADHLGMSLGGAHKRVRSAVNNIQKFLGGFRPHEDPAEEHVKHENPHNYPDCDFCRDNLWEGGYVGTRAVRSNAHARAAAENAYDK